MTAEQISIIVSIICYLLTMVGIGLYWSNKMKNVGDFYLGGRKLGPFVTAMSAEASDMSSWLLMGLPAIVYLSGVADATWTAIGLAIGTYLNWLLVAKRIRIYTYAADNSITLPDFFSHRYKDEKNILMLISAVVIIVFFIPYTASGFAACGKLFASLFEVDYLSSMIVSAVVIVAYTVAGGFSAASTTDLIQSMVMTVALFIVVFFGMSVAGGFETVIKNAQEIPGYFSMNETFNSITNTSSPYTALMIISTLAWGLGYFGMPHVLIRFMAIENQEKLKYSRRIATIWVIISMAVAIFIGVVGLSMTKMGAIPELMGPNSETLIVQIAQLLSQNGIFVALIAGLILAGILAATMSTADSQLLAAASSVSHNLMQGFFKIKMSQKQAMLVARLSVIAISVIAVFIARDPNSSVFNIVSFAWAGFGAAFGPVVLAALFWKRSNKQGAFAGMVTGGIMVFVWEYIISPIGGVWGIYELLPAFICGSLAIVLVSLLTPAPTREIVEEFEKVEELARNS